jgi:predicted RNA-binding Zn-ribbon protein involved in translation (DUF1610 family)
MGNGEDMNEIELDLERYICDQCGWVEDIEWTISLKGQVQSFQCDSCGGTKRKSKETIECQERKLMNSVKQIIGPESKSSSEQLSSSDKKENTMQKSLAQPSTT